MSGHDQQDVRAGQIYRHFKHGTRYEIVCLATHTETEEEMAVYRDLNTGRCFTRPLAMFVGLRESEDGRAVTRFELEAIQHGQERPAEGSQGTGGQD